MPRRVTGPNGTNVERRKTPRFTVTVPMEVSWRGPDKRAIKEQAVARQVNVNGGLLEMSNYPDIGNRVSLTNFLSAKTAEARVLATPTSREGVAHGIIVELIEPSESFWGVSLQVKKAGVELQKLEKALQAEGIDFRVLNEFRDATEYLRTTAIAVQQLRECQLRGQRDEDVVASLTSGRLRRTKNLCLEVIADFDAGKVKAETKGAEELLRALEQTCERLRRVVMRRDPDRSFLTRT